jgi:ubiquinone/menaquinone biosynthesis C-methylase UbiE
VLDVACGTGVVARLAAERAGPAGRVAALDVNPGMLAVGRALPPVDGAPVEWHEASALALPFEDGSFSVGLCQLGLMFFPDRALALGELRRVLEPGGRLGLSVYAEIEHNPATNALSEALDRRIGEGASQTKRSEHALADAALLEQLVVDAGFVEVRIERVTLTVRYPSAADYVRIQFAGTPLAGVLPPGRRDQAVAAITGDVGEALARYVGADGLAFPQEAHVALAAA